MMLKINKVSHVQTLERGRSGDERADIGCQVSVVRGADLTRKRFSLLL